MLSILCATCDDFVYAHKIELHLAEFHPEQEIIRLRTWPNGEPVIMLDNEFNLFFSAND